MQCIYATHAHTGEFSASCPGVVVCPLCWVVFSWHTYNWIPLVNGKWSAYCEKMWEAFVGFSTLLRGSWWGQGKFHTYMEAEMVNVIQHLQLLTGMHLTKSDSHSAQNSTVSNVFGRGSFKSWNHIWKDWNGMKRIYRIYSSYPDPDGWWHMMTEFGCAV